jgi:hypothetical protein
LRNQSGYDFFYNLKLIKSAKPVTVHIKNAELKDALAEIFSGQPLTYTITTEDKAVLVKELKERVTPAPPHAVTGKVVDEQGTADRRCSKCKANNAAVATDVNGNFTITVPNDNAILVSLLLDTSQ